MKRLKEVLKKWNTSSDEKWVIHRYLDFYRFKPKSTFKPFGDKKIMLTKYQKSANNLAKFIQKEM